MPRFSDAVTTSWSCNARMRAASTGCVTCFWSSVKVACKQDGLPTAWGRAWSRARSFLSKIRAQNGHSRPFPPSPRS
eukprot:7439395-Pyramimonas_sp.AAC.1